MNKSCRIVFFSALIIGLTVVALSCTLSSKPIETEADFIGFITEIQPVQDRDVTGQISVESHADKIVTRYVITIKGDTLLFHQNGENLRKTTFNTLETKQWVKIWFSGPVMESWPMQATAQQVVVADYAALFE